LATKDGVQLRLTYFPAAQRKVSEARQATPVVLLHDHKETRAVFNSLALKLQEFGSQPKNPTFACVTVDLRGHGDSTRQLYPDGSQVDLGAARISKQQLQAMAAFDMETVRSFLVGKNDAGELNLNKLCLVGAGMGANVAVNWALQDWTAPPLAIKKQGQDVKALVLVSPRWSYSGLSFQGPMRFRPLKENVAWQLIYGGADAKVAVDVRRIQKQLERFHPAPSGAAGQRLSSLQIIAWPESNLQGSLLLRQVGAQLEAQIVGFLVEQVAKTQQPWTSRLDILPR
jgi:pimeloyl-ACP methyl ester carboxylesterase